MNLCIPTLNRYDRLEECVRSALNGSLVPDIIILDNGNKLDVDDFYTKLPSIARDKLNIVVSFGKNLGVSASWNYFLTNISYPMIISNDDIVFGKHDIERFNTAIKYYPEYDFFQSNSIPQVNMFSCFSMRKQLFDVIGAFDVVFYPAYYEDNDYRRRMKLAGYDDMIMMVDTKMTHSNSSTLEAYTIEEKHQHHVNFAKNQAYYISKWGGFPEHETYTKPFDGQY